jgi:AraC-like DNA-binding protein
MVSETTYYNIASNHQEIRSRGSAGFPCSGYRNYITLDSSKEVPWHWHEELELIYVVEGSLKVRLPGEQIVINQGEGIFINTNILHAANSHEKQKCLIHSLVFYDRLIAGDKSSIFATVYVQPILNCPALKYTSFTSASQWEKEAAACIEKAFQKLAYEDQGYELLIRNDLSLLWSILFRQSSDKLSSDKYESEIDYLRIKIMISFLEEHFNEQIDIAQIAASANVGKRECIRCFHKMIGLSPIQYLIKYRISESLHYLRDTDMPISEIALCSGFDSPSYFAQIFKRYQKCTPRQFRS